MRLQKVGLTYSGVTSGQEDSEGGRQINVLVSQGDQHTTSSASQFSVEHWVQDGVIALYILNQKRVAKSQGRFQILAERVIKEAT